MTLSLKKQRAAIECGEAVTKQLFRDWLEYGTHDFPNGIRKMREFCCRMAAVHLPLGKPFGCSQEEKDLASKAAGDLFDLVVNIHNRGLGDDE